MQHLLTFLELKQPGPLFRAFVLMTQGIFFNLYFLYVLIPLALNAPRLELCASLSVPAVATLLMELAQARHPLSTCKGAIWTLQAWIWPSFTAHISNRALVFMACMEQGLPA